MVFDENCIYLEIKFPTICTLINNNVFYRNDNQILVYLITAPNSYPIVRCLDKGEEFLLKLGPNDEQVSAAVFDHRGKYIITGGAKV